MIIYCFLWTEDTAMPIQYKVTLTNEEKQQLQSIVSQGKSSARKIKRAQILIQSSNGCYDNQVLIDAFGVSNSTIARVRRNFVEDGLEAALSEGGRSGQPRKLTAKDEAILVATACSTPPEGRARWTLSLLGEKLVTLSDIDNVSVETIRQRLKDNDLKPWQKKMWCLKNFDAPFIAQMEDILDLYAEEPDGKRPIVNFDEAGKQLVDHVNPPKLAKPGVVAKEDYEYERVGVTNIFMHFDRHRGWRKVKVTNKKDAIEFANCMKELVDEDYPNAEVVRVVLDNFSPHSKASLYKAFSPEEALRISKRIEFHFTPAHASWLNMAEIEIGNMNQQCLDRRLPNIEVLRYELERWQEIRNEEKASIKWMFNVDAARTKFERSYEKLNRQN